MSTQGDIYWCSNISKVLLVHIQLSRQRCPLYYYSKHTAPPKGELSHKARGFCQDSYVIRNLSVDTASQINTHGFISGNHPTKKIQKSVSMFKNIGTFI